MNRFRLIADPVILDRGYSRVDFFRNLTVKSDGQKLMRTED